MQRSYNLKFEKRRYHLIWQTKNSYAKIVARNSCLLKVSKNFTKRKALPTNPPDVQIVEKPAKPRGTVSLTNSHTDNKINRHQRRFFPIKK
jgi:hypothetical protein